VQPGRFAPKCSLNGPVGGDREYAVVRQSLDDVKRIGRTFDAKVNDVVLAAVTSGLRRLLDERGELADVPYVQALVPVSVRSDDERLSLGNKVSALFAKLPVGEDDPLERLEQLRTGMADLKEGPDATLLAAVLGTADTWPPALLSAVSELTVHRQPFVNLVVTNVPGPPMPLYVLGSLMTECYPYVPLAKNLTIGVAILSYNGQLNIAVTSDPARAPDTKVLVDGIAAGFDELAGLAGA
jgi:WS/DGAT/MGAT family acyltransferase